MRLKIQLACVLASTLSGLGGCGQALDESEVRTDGVYDDGLVLKIGNAGAREGEYDLYVGGPTSIASVGLCVLIGTQTTCDRDLAASPVTSSAVGRKIFKVDAPVKLAADVRFRLTARLADGSTAERKLGVQAASGPVDPGNGGGNGSLRWKMVLMASDQGSQGAWINAFDNARKKLKEIFSGMGVPAADFREMSLHPNQQSESVKPTSYANLDAALKSLNATGPNDACLVHMTSHGSPNGFNLGHQRLKPSDLDRSLTESCGDRPTVVLISACFSGLYVLDSSGVKKPNRVILTAARHDVTSFGCSPENQYTYWDGCLIESIPGSATWRDLAGKIQACIVRKEGGQTASFPQTFIGSGVESLPLPGSAQSFGLADAW